MVSPATEEPPRMKDYLELALALEQVQTTISELETMVASDGKWGKECRDYSPAKTVRCAAVKFRPPGGVDMALSVWRCESNFGTESPHSDSYHGPFQYALGTYAGQRAMMPDVVRWNKLSSLVHDTRSNIMMAVAWAAHHDWGPWTCA